MKNFHLLCALLVFPLLVFPQKSFSDEFTYLATYSLKYQEDSTDLGSVQIETMLLYLGDKSSRFSSAGRAKKDFLLANRDKANRSAAGFRQFSSQIPPTQVHYSIVKHYPSGAISFTETIALDDFRVPQDLEVFSWEILGETKELAGYQAQKATTSFAGRDYTAWFTSEIPIPDGPYKFNGLPGLILQISDTDNHYVFELTGFEKLETPMPFEFKHKDFITTDSQKFLKVKEQYEKDPLAAIERAGIKIEFSPGQREELQRKGLEKRKKRNNPLELEP